VRKLARRALKARQLGLSFAGTSKFKLPRAARLDGEMRSLSFPDDRPLALDIIDVWLDDDYGLETIEWPVTTILDVGANVGVFSLWALHNFPSAQIHAYEPNRAILPHLSANLAGLKNVKVWPEGISDQDGRAHLKKHDSSRLAQTEIDQAGEVELTALGRAVERLGGTVDVLKLDCEGAEWSIFGAAEPLGMVREIRMEYHLTNGRNIEDLRIAAALIGFDIEYLRENCGFGMAFLSNQRPAKLTSREPRT